MCDGLTLRLLDNLEASLGLRISALELREMPDFTAELGGIRLLRDEMSAFLSEARALFAGAQQAVESAEETADETIAAVEDALAEDETPPETPPEETPLMEQEIPLPEMLEPEEEEKDDGPDRTPFLERKLAFGRR